jgi:hypothetical protein
VVRRCSGCVCVPWVSRSKEKRGQRTRTDLRGSDLVGDAGEDGIPPGKAGIAVPAYACEGLFLHDGDGFRPAVGRVVERGAGALPAETAEVGGGIERFCGHGGLSVRRAS